MTDLILHPNLPNGTQVRERFCIYGWPDSGKTHALLQIARWHHDLGSDARFHVLNLDGTFDMLISRPEFIDLPNVEYRSVEGHDAFGEIFETLFDWHQKLRDQDWLVVDPGGYVWDACVNKFRVQRATERAKKEGRQLSNFELLLELDTPVEGWEYGQPNTWYGMYAKELMMAGKGHRLTICHADQLLEPSAGMKEDAITKANRLEYAHVGAKPRSQKHDPQRWASVLFTQAKTPGRPEEGQLVISGREKQPGRRKMGKQLGEGLVKGEEVFDLYQDYLVDIAGWKG